MPMLENVAELAEHLASLCGIYSQGIRFEGMTAAESRAQTDWLVDHAADCLCRMCWCGIMERRIRSAVATEALLARAEALKWPQASEEFFHG